MLTNWTKKKKIKKKLKKKKRERCSVEPGVQKRPVENYSWCSSCWRREINWCVCISGTSLWNRSAASVTRAAFLLQPQKKKWLSQHPPFLTKHLLSSCKPPRARGVTLAPEAWWHLRTVAVSALYGTAATINAHTLSLSTGEPLGFSGWEWKAFVCSGSVQLQNCHRQKSVVSAISS